jgi:hypothetical protein
MYQDGISKELEDLLERIGRMRLAELRELWRTRWGAPPRLRSVRLLRRLIAWRLQEPMFGGLKARTRSLLQSKSIPKWGHPAVGARLTREYRGVLHEVETLPDGYRYLGRDYPNLSRIAEAITGTHWNGPRFFGLRDGPKHD